MDQLVAYLCYARSDGAEFADRVDEMLRTSSYAVGILPDTDESDQPSGVHGADARIGGVDVVMLLLTRQSAMGDPRCQETLDAADRLGKPVLVLRLDSALRPTMAYEDRLIDFSTTSPGWTELRRRLDEIGSPEKVRDDCVRALSAWHGRMPNDADPMGYHQAVLAPIETEIAQHESRLRDADHLRREVRSAVLASFQSAANRAAAARRQPRSLRVHADTPDHRGKFHDREYAVAEVTERLADHQLRVLAVHGPRGIGKTAMLTRVGDRLSARLGHALPYLYQSAHGNASLTATMLLGALAGVLDTAQPNGDYTAMVRNVERNWAEKVTRLLDALADTHVLLVVDNADDLLDHQSEFADPEIGGVVEMLLDSRRQHGVRLLLVGAVPAIPPRLSERYPERTDTIALTAGLRVSDAEELLRGLDPDGFAGLAGDRARNLRRLAELVHGSPRALELAYGVLRVHPRASVPTLLGTLEPIEASSEREQDTVLTDWILDGLSRAELRVVQALAVFAHPVSPAAVDALLFNALPGFRSQPSLDRLAAIRFVVRYGEQYHLSASPEGERALARLPGGRGRRIGEDQRSMTQRELLWFAAFYYAKLAEWMPSPPTAVDDLEPQLHEIRLLLRAGLFANAWNRSYALDAQHLTPWRQSHILIDARRQMQGNLGTDTPAEVSNLSLLAAAYTQVGRHEDAARAIADADDELFRRDDHARGARRVHLELQRAGTELDRGRIMEAGRHYEEARREAQAESGMPNQLVTALHGIMQCQTEQGKFGLALRTFDLATGLAAPSLHVTARLNLSVARPRGYLGMTAEALESLDHAERLASGLDDAIVGLCQTARATLAMDLEDHTTAATYATRAVHLAGKRAYLRLSREANVRLAQAQLYAGNLSAAREAAEFAVRFTDSRRYLSAFALLGLVAFRQGATEVAEVAMQAASAQAAQDIQLSQNTRAPKPFEVYDWYGMVLCVLAIYGKAEVVQAVRAYEAARDITDAPVAVNRSLRLLRTVLGNDQPAKLAPAWDAASRRR